MRRLRNTALNVTGAQINLLLYCKFLCLCWETYSIVVPVLSEGGNFEISRYFCFCKVLEKITLIFAKISAKSAFFVFAKIFAKNIQDFRENFRENLFWSFLRKIYEVFAKSFAKIGFYRFRENFCKKIWNFQLKFVAKFPENLTIFAWFSHFRENGKMHFRFNPTGDP
jgi:hypothetical protein